MAKYDCLLIGHNELDFQDYFGILENMASSSGRDHVAFTDLQLNHIELKGRRYQATDILTELYNEGLPADAQRAFYNGDCFWSAISYLGTYLHRRDYTYDYINLFQHDKESLKQKLRDNEYTLIALTGTMYVFEQNIWEVISFIRRQRRDAKIIAGGPYISKQAEEREPEYLKPLFKYLNADFYCYSREGEQTLTQVIDALKNGTDFAQIPNLAYRQGRDFMVTPQVREHNALRSNLIDYSLFADEYRKSGWANVRISDGCPYACGFCAFPEHGNDRYLIMSPADIERELDAIHASGAITHLFFIDATLNVPKKQFKDMLQLMIRKQYGFKWHCFFRCDQADEETIALMGQAGCIGVFLGLESANEVVLKNMDKTAHKADFRRTMPWFRKYGIRQMVSVQIGFPGETYESAQEKSRLRRGDSARFLTHPDLVLRPDDACLAQAQQVRPGGQGLRMVPLLDGGRDRRRTRRGFLHGLARRDLGPRPRLQLGFVLYSRKIRNVDRATEEVSGVVRGDRQGETAEAKPAEPDPGLLSALRACAQFDRCPEPDMSVLEPYSGERYRAGEAFWLAEFAGDHIERCEPVARKASTALVSVDSTELGADVLLRLAAAFQASPTDVLLVAWSILAAERAQATTLPLVISRNRDDVLPFCATIAEAEDFASHLAGVTARLTTVEPHRLYGFFALTNAARLKAHGQMRPRIPRRLHGRGAG